MKKILTTILVMVVMSTLVACGNATRSNTAIEPLSSTTATSTPSTTVVDNTLKTSNSVVSNVKVYYANDQSWHSRKVGVFNDTLVDSDGSTHTFYIFAEDITDLELLETNWDIVSLDLLEAGLVKLQCKNWIDGKIKMEGKISYDGKTIVEMWDGSGY